MSLTRECVIRYLTEVRQASPAIIANYHKVHLSEVMAVVTDGDDFERVAPAAGTGDCWHWRLSSLANDLTVRRAACAHLRDAVAPPQSAPAKPITYTRERLPSVRGAVMRTWFMANPGEWSMEQIAASRGVSVPTIYSQLKALGAGVVKSHHPGMGRTAFYRLAVHALGARPATPLSTAS